MTLRITDARKPKIPLLAKMAAFAVTILLCAPGLEAMRNQYFRIVLNRYNHHVIEAYGHKAVLMGLGTIALGLMPLGLLMPNRFVAALWCLACFGAGVVILFVSR